MVINHLLNGMILQVEYDQPKQLTPGSAGQNKSLP